MKNIDSITILDDNNFIIRNDNKVYIDTDNNIYCVIAKGVQTAEIANAHYYIIEKLFRNKSEKFSFFIDVNDCDKNYPEARKMWKYLIEHPKTKKVVVFGTHPVAKMIAHFVIGTLIKKEKIRFCESKEEGLTWLKE